MVHWVEGEKADIILNARVDVSGKSLMLHSRGGSMEGRPPRNPDYQRALRLLLRRGCEDGAITRIAIDSSEAHKAPPAERTLFEADELADFEPDALAREVGLRLAAWPQKPEEKSGGNRTKRVLIETRYLYVSQRFRLRKAGPGKVEHELIERGEFERLTRAHLDEAVEALRSGTIHPDFGSHTHYSVLLDDGTKLRPKAIIGLALSILRGQSVSWSQFRGGENTPCFATLRKHGFTIVHEAADKGFEKSQSGDASEAVDNALGDHTLTDEDRRFIEGSVYRAKHLKRERNRQLVTEFKEAFLRKHGSFHCEKCSRDWIEEYGESVAVACFEAHHQATQVAEMEDGHQSKLEDLQLLCANCHRAVHREMAVGA
ncbi:hypothetical protein [Altericroceibacterium endophyticum]|uniref:ScoMcrA-like N-terminal head domain-containing protein n=1 Tax=Altericroceibacterium endophyticum TaxID=1808508 RepID=A0A6I4T8M9_9SPHN|nr:hypothetical protein [Altericroceibacterium endophyticum]MXO66230.1 hypothetical protein [Altericroceibacterium endophyticum]